MYKYGACVDIYSGDPFMHRHQKVKATKTTS